MKVIHQAHQYEVYSGVPNQEELWSQKIYFVEMDENGYYLHGTTNEELLSVLIDRTMVLNAKFNCMENDIAINCMKAALAAFNIRTRDRMNRGVEGKHLE